MAVHAEVHHGPPIAHKSSRVDAPILGIFLFIASEIMLFGAFFTAYFFVRVAAGTPWPTPPFHLPVFVAGVNTVILVTSSFTMHWALQSIKRDNHAGLQAGLLLTFLMGLTFLLTQVREYSRTCVSRKVSPMRKVSVSPALSPAWLSRLIDWRAQCMVKLEVTGITVFTPATKTGRWKGGVGHGVPAATRTKKYAVKNAPKSITSDAMKRKMPRIGASTRELRCAIGGPWWASA